MSRIKCYEKGKVQWKDYTKNPRGSKEELLNEKRLAISRTKTHDQREQTAQVPSEKRGDHVWRVNFKRSLRMVAIGPVEIDRSFQKKQDFSENTCLKTSLNIYL